MKFNQRERLVLLALLSSDPLTLRSRYPHSTMTLRDIVGLTNIRQDDCVEVLQKFYEKKLVTNVGGPTPHTWRLEMDNAQCRRAYNLLNKGNTRQLAPIQRRNP